MNLKDQVALEQQMINAFGRDAFISSSQLEVVILDETISPQGGKLTSQDVKAIELALKQISAEGIDAKGVVWEQS